MMSNELKPPNEYAEQLAAINAQQASMGYPILKLRLERKTNRHPETGGGEWGWYEIFPIRLTVGYWGSTRDDLRSVDIPAWNKLADALENT